MKNFLILIYVLFIAQILFAKENYNVYDYDKYTMPPSNEKTLFIMDYSNSMNEYLGDARKVDLMIDTMNKILPSIGPNKEVGLRVYGHRMGLTTYDCCKASKLSVPITFANATNISKQLSKTKAMGMTPITYSLKKAVNNDFGDFTGKKHIILLSDGGENCDESPCKYVMENLTKRKDILIDVIAFNVNNHDDIDQLRCVAMVTSGKFYTANTRGELIDAINNSLKVNKEVGGVIVK